MTTAEDIFGNGWAKLMTYDERHHKFCEDSKEMLKEIASLYGFTFKDSILMATIVDNNNKDEEYISSMAWWRHINIDNVNITEVRGFLEAIKESADWLIKINEKVQVNSLKNMPPEEMVGTLIKSLLEAAKNSWASKDASDEPEVKEIIEDMKKKGFEWKAVMVDMNTEEWRKLHDAIKKYQKWGTIEPDVKDETKDEKKNDDSDDDTKNFIRWLFWKK